MPLKQTVFPNAGLRVPIIALGASGFSTACRQEALAILHAAPEYGLNFVDTSDNYANGESEEIIGEVTRGKRHQYVIATKCGHNPSAKGASRKTIRTATEASLRRLGTDHIDLMQVHAPDATTPLQETIAVLQDLVREGKILYYGLSNFEAWQLVDAYHLAKSMNGPLPTSAQAQVSLIRLKNHKELSRALQRTKIGLLAASPLARGLLGRIYGSSNPVPKGHPLDGPKGTLTMTPGNAEIASRLAAEAAERGCQPVALALACVLNLPGVVSVVVRPRHRNDLQDYAAVSSLSVSRSDISRIAYGEAAGERFQSRMGVV